MDFLQEIADLAVAGGFGEIWEDCDRRRAFELCNDVRERLGMPCYSPTVLDKGWQYRNIFAEDKEQAMDEFVNFVLGWW